MKRSLFFLISTVVIAVCFLPAQKGDAEAKKAVRVTLAGPYEIKINYAKKLSEMIAEGKYAAANPWISDAHFMVVGSGGVSVETMLVGFSHEMEPSEVLEALASRNLAPAYIEHLLAFGARYPNEQTEHPIAALGAPGGIVVDDSEEEYDPDIKSEEEKATQERARRSHSLEQIVGCLVDNYAGRSLEVAWFDGPSHLGWPKEYYFLAIKKAKKK